MPDTGQPILRVLVALAIIAASSAIFGWVVVTGTMSHPQVREMGEPPPGQNSFGAYDWSDHDRKVIEQRDLERSKLPAWPSWIR